MNGASLAPPHLRSIPTPSRHLFRHAAAFRAVTSAPTLRRCIRENAVDGWRLGKRMVGAAVRWQGGRPDRGVVDGRLKPPARVMATRKIATPWAMPLQLPPIEGYAS